MVKLRSLYCKIGNGLLNAVASKVLDISDADRYLARYQVDVSNNESPLYAECFSTERGAGGESEGRGSHCIRKHPSRNYLNDNFDLPFSRLADPHGTRGDLFNPRSDPLQFVSSTIPQFTSSRVLHHNNYFIKVIFLVMTSVWVKSL